CLRCSLDGRRRVNRAPEHGEQMLKPCELNTHITLLNSLEFDNVNLKKPSCKEPQLTRLRPQVYGQEVRSIEYRCLDVRAAFLLQRVLDLAGQFEPPRTLAEQNLRDSHV